MRKHLPLIVLIIASIVVHFLYFGYPKQTVFDEVHFGKFASGYFTHQYFFDIHPPLGQLLVSGMGYITGFKPGFSFATIGEEFPDKKYMALRFLPMLAGTLLPIIIFFLILRLGMSKIAAFAASMLLILDNALLVQSRFILLDLFLLAFGFGSLLAYLKYRQDRRPLFFVLAILLATLSLSVKWTGATFLAIIGIAEIVALIRSHTARKISLIATMFILPLLIYFSVFAIHLKILNRSGDGDNFMTPEFKKTLVGSYDYSREDIKPLSLFGKFIELNKTMYRANAGLTASHPYGSKLYEWPFMIGFCRKHADIAVDPEQKCSEYGRPPIYYWNSTIDGQNARIYLLGNPIIWWSAAFAILFVLLNVILSVKEWFKKRSFGGQGMYVLLAAVYLFNLLPFIGVTRILFLYHYFAALIVAVIALVYIVDQLSEKRAVFSALIGLSLLAFVYFAPLSYGKPVSDTQYKHRVWFQNSWQ